MGRGETKLNTALVQVLGAIAYGEHKAYDNAVARAEASTEETERRMWRTIAAEELRHHKGFVRRLKALGADPGRAMAPFKPALDRFHAMTPESDDVRAAVLDVLGEGVASDLLQWLRAVCEVHDPETARFVDTVIADEQGHEARAVAEVRTRMASAPDGRRQGAEAALTMLLRMAMSGPETGFPFVAFVRLGRPGELVGTLASGYHRRLLALGIGPLPALARLDRTGTIGRLLASSVVGARRAETNAA
ncbi:MAG: ferritin-like fold-containing protein [Acidimicrobiales bacterium]